MTNKILTIMAMAIMAVACTQKVDEPLQYGELSVTLAGEPTVEVVSKALQTLEPTAPEAVGYVVRIFDSSDQMMYEKTYDAFEAQRLPLGTYYVTAENCTEAQAEAGNGRMRLYGCSGDVIISAEDLTPTATVNCVVTNAKVSVEYDESVADRFTGLQVTLAGGTTEGRTLTIAQTATGVVTETWFNPSELTYTISGTFIGSGMNKPVSITRSLTLEAKNNIKLLVKVNLENGQLMPGLTIDTQIDDPQEKEEEFNPYV